MQIHKNYKYRLYPNKSQIDLLNSHFFSSNQAWNFMLDFKIKEIKNQSSLDKKYRKYTNFKDLYDHTTVDLKSRRIVYNSGVVQDKMRSLDSTFKLFYTKKSEGQGFPKFRTSKNIQQSFVIRNQATSWTSSHLKIFKSPIKWDFHRPIPDDAKFNGGVVKRESDGKYYVILNLTIDEEYQDLETGIECGLDLNVKNIAISSTDDISRFIYLKDFSKSKYSSQFRKLQTQLSRRYLKKNFSKNTKRLQKKQNKIQRKIKNQKEDQFHKISNVLTNKFDRITIENLQINKMKESQKTHLNRLISDVSWNSLIQKLQYKSEMKNKIIREIDPAFTSQRCFKCGDISKNNRKSQSDFSCLNCKHTENADINASLNILWYDKWSLEQTALISSRKSESLSIPA